MQNEFLSAAELADEEDEDFKFFLSSEDYFLVLQNRLDALSRTAERFIDICVSTKFYELSLDDCFNCFYKRIFDLNRDLTRFIDKSLFIK